MLRPKSFWAMARSAAGLEPLRRRQVRVVNVTPGQFANEDWVEVTGTIYPIGREVIVDASGIAEVARPDRPYLTP